MNGSNIDSHLWPGLVVNRQDRASRGAQTARNVGCRSGVYAASLAEK